MFVGSSNFLLIPISHSMLPGNRGRRQDFSPLLMHNLLCNGQADPTPTPMLQFMFNYSLKFKPQRQKRRRSLLTKGICRPRKNWFASPCREKLIYLGLQHAGRPPRQHILADRRVGQTASSLPVLVSQRAPSSMPSPQCNLDKTQSTVHK